MNYEFPLHRARAMDKEALDRAAWYTNIYKIYTHTCINTYTHTYMTTFILMHAYVHLHICAHNCGFL